MSDPDTAAVAAGTIATGSAPQGAGRLPGLRAIAPMIAGVALLCAGNSLLSTMVGLTLVHGGINKAFVQPIVTGYPLGFLLGCIAARGLIVRLTHGPAFAVLAALAVGATLALTRPFDVWSWTAFRLINGFCMAGCFTTVESWVNLNAGRSDRGLLLACYMVATSLGLSCGQAMLGWGSLGGHGLFWIAALVLGLSPLPLLALARRPALPRAQRRAEHAPMDFKSFLAVAPLAVLAAAQAGMTNLNFSSIAPIYGAMIGLRDAQVGSLVIAFSLGGLCVQPAIGWLSDRFDRRALLATAAGTSTLLCAALAAAGPLPLGMLLPTLFVYGAATLAIYPIALALAAARVSRALVVSMSGKFLMVYSCGSIVAPAISTTLMERLAPQAMFGFLGCLVGIVAVCSIAAYARRGAGEGLTPAVAGPSDDRVSARP